MFWLKDKIEKNNKFYKKKTKKKLEIKTMRIKLENIISLIWIEWWNWKPIKLLQNDQGKNRNPKNKNQIEKHNIW